MGKTLEDVESGNCGTGPDYKMNTADDGMPVTYTDFIALLAKMESDGVTPFTWAGQTTYQRARAFESIWANYEGPENFHLNFAVKDITDEQLSQAGVKKPYEYLALQQGRKAAIKFFYDIVENEYYTEKAFTQSGMQAGALYVKSIATDNPIAFCVGASNWENALSKEFGELVKETGNSNYAYGKRNFKIFPIPNFVDVEGIADQTNKDSREVLPGYYTDTLAFIANRPSCDNPTLQKHLAKLFLQFTSSRRQAVEFMSNTGGVMSMYKFTIEEHETSLLTKYGQDICRYIKEGAVIVPYTEYASERKAKLTFNPFILTGDNIQKYYYDPATAFKENPNLTVEECFKKVQTGVRSLF